MQNNNYIEFKADLTPCPFCGRTTVTVWGARIDHPDLEWSWTVECKCGACIRGKKDTSAKAINAWERRFCKDDIEEDGYITWKHYRDRFVNELTARIEGRDGAD